MMQIVLTEKAKWDWDREFQCPECGGRHFGTSRLPGEVETGHCHDQFGKGCRFTWPRSEDERVFVLRSHSQIRDEIAWLRCFDVDEADSERAAKIADTLEKLLSVYEAAEEARRYLHPEAPMHVDDDLERALDAVQNRQPR